MACKGGRSKNILMDNNFTDVSVLKKEGVRVNVKPKDVIIITS